MLVLNNNGMDHVVFILLINVKMPTIVGILTFMSKINIYCGRGFDDEPRFSFLKTNRRIHSLHYFDYEYNYK